MKHAPVTVIMEIMNMTTGEFVKRHEISWYSRHARDFITRTISWAAINGYGVQIYNKGDDANA